MSLVRIIVGALGIVALVTAALTVLHGAPVVLTLWLLGFGLVLTVAALFERVIYKKIAPSAPGRGWIATGERFVDPATGRLVEVHFRPETGQRSYVDAGAAPPHDGA